jgi:hypothetical protein
MMMNKLILKSKFKWRAENITAGETRQRKLNDRAEGLMPETKFHTHIKPQAKL